MPTIPTWSIRNLGVSRGDTHYDSTGGAVSTTEAVIATVLPFLGNIVDRVRLYASVLGKIQITATTKGSQGGVSIEFRLRKDSVSGTILDTKVIAMSYTTVSPLLDLPVTLIGIDFPGLEAQTKTYVLTAKKILGTNITATADWDEAKFQATVLSA